MGRWFYLGWVGNEQRTLRCLTYCYPPGMSSVRPLVFIKHLILFSQVEAVFKVIMTVEDTLKIMALVRTCTCTIYLFILEGATCRVTRIGVEAFCFLQIYSQCCGHASCMVYAYVCYRIEFTSISSSTTQPRTINWFHYASNYGMLIFFVMHRMSTYILE